MTNKPLVSICIPVYNHQNYVTQCLESILKDPFPNKEIVIINDGSTDDSDAAVKGWIENHKGEININYIQRENKGLSATLNELITLAHGKYIIHIASDDFLLPGGIEMRLNYLQQNPHKKAVFGDCIVVDEQNNIVHKSGIEELYGGKKTYLLHAGLLAYELIFNWCVPGPVIMYQKDVINLIGRFDESLMVEDWDFYLRLASRKLVGFIDAPVGAYRLHSTNMMKRAASDDFKISKYLTIKNNLHSFRGFKKMRLQAYKAASDYQHFATNNAQIRSCLAKVKASVLYRITTLFYKKYLPISYVITDK